jgi:ferredoxin-nitrate reductase
LRTEPTRTRTVCPYCGVGCGLVAETRGDRLEAVLGDPSYPVNRGRVCAKPVALPEASASRDRATVPLRRDGREGRWREQTWERSIGWAAGRLEEIRSRHGPEAIAFYISGQLLTEDYYAVTKLAKGFIGTNNVDSNSRLCMSSAVAGYEGAFGSDGPPPAYDDIAEARCFLLLGTNTAACHPILWSRIRARQSEGAKVIVVDPRRTETAAAADLHLPVLPGTDLALLNAMLWVIEKEELVDRSFVDRCTEGYEETMRAASRWPPAQAERTCGVKAREIAEAARMFAGAEASMALWSMGANQSTVGTMKNRAINNLCLISGQLGRPGTGPLSLTGQPNAMGGREVGGLSQLLPGYRKIASAIDREEMSALWRLPEAAAGISPERGLTATELFDALEAGTVRAVWICATNPVVSMPRGDRVRAALAKAELVVCQDAYHPTETSACADLLLPAAQWPEKEGTMTNSERRVALCRKALEPPGEALADWEIFARLGRALGHDEHFAWSTPAEVYDEFAALTAGRHCDHSGISHDRLRSEGSLQWPCPAEPGPEAHPGTPRLYLGGRFPTASGRARLEPTPHAPPAERTDAEMPLVLNTGRVASQWHTMTRTAKSERLLLAEPEPFVELHTADAASAGVADGAMVNVVSRRGVARMRARVGDTVPEGTAFAPFHWGALHLPPGAGPLNSTTTRAVDPVSGQPELKACAVRVEPVSGTGGRGRGFNRGRRRLLVVGTGMAGLATAEAVLEHEADSWEVTMLGAERDPPYNRIQLSEALGRRDQASVELREPGWYERRGIELRLGVRADRLDVERRSLITDDGEELAYDSLVLATGSRPSLPTVAGIDRDGVFSFRTAEDARRIAAAAAGAGRASVVGGGLLGLEAARGLLELGVEVTVVHLLDRLMETQLDGAASRLLAREMRRLGVELLLGRSTSELIGNGRVEGLRFADGEELEAELVVFATGIRPEVETARSSGIETGRGILVDDQLRTSAPGVWAVGECAEHRGTVYGVWGPLREQARVAGAAIVGGVAAYFGQMPATSLKVMGVDLFCAGRPEAADDVEDELVAGDGRASEYRKLVVREDRLVGAILLGDLALSSQIAELARTGRPVPDGLLTGAGPTAESRLAPDDAPVCLCNWVSRGQILAAIDERGLTTPVEVAAATGAGSGCGGCASTVADILTEREVGRLEDLRYARLSRR